MDNIEDMEKNVEFGFLLDFYGEFLTERQRMLMDYYYNQDFSLAEIAAQEGISRQAVNDALHRSEGILKEMEARLGMAKRYICVLRGLEELEVLLSQLEVKTKSTAALANSRVCLEKIKSAWEDCHGV